MNYETYKAIGDKMNWYINAGSKTADLDDLKAYVEELLSLPQEEMTERLAGALDARWNVAQMGGGDYTNLLMDADSYGYVHLLTAEINEQIQCSMVAIQKAFGVYLPIMEDQEYRSFTNYLCTRADGVYMAAMNRGEELCPGEIMFHLVYGIASGDVEL